MQDQPEPQPLIPPGVNVPINSSILTPLWAALLFFGGCRPPDIVHHTLPVAPDVAIYGGGVYFRSKDGLEKYESVVILPERLTENVQIVFPDGTLIDAKELSADNIQEHGVRFDIDRDNDKGDFKTSAGHAMHVHFRDYQVERIATFPEYDTPGLISIHFRDKHIVVPIKCVELEKLLGKPEEIKHNTFPPDR